MKDSNKYFFFQFGHKSILLKSDKVLSKINILNIRVNNINFTFYNQQLSENRLEKSNDI